MIFGIELSGNSKFRVDLFLDNLQVKQSNFISFPSTEVVHNFSKNKRKRTHPQERYGP
jgi:hypothetical protein